MIALPFETRGALLLANDDAEAARVYVCLTRPRVARRPDGSSRARLVRWVPPSRPAETAGARLSLDLELDPATGELADHGVDHANAQRMPWLDATVRLDGPGFDPVESEVSIAVGVGSAVAVDLTPAAAALLADLLSSDVVSPLQVTWRGRVLVRLPPVEVIASAEITEVRRRVTMLGPGRQRTSVKHVIDGHARIEIRNAGNPALEQALRDWVLDELATRLERGEPLSVKASASDVVPWPIELSTTLDDLIPPASRDSIVETLVLDDEALGTTLPLEVRVLGDFAEQLERVDVRIVTDAGVREVVFTSDSVKRVPIGTRTFEWSSRVKPRGRPASDWSTPAQAAHVTTLIVPVRSAQARRRIEVFGAGLNFSSRWSSVRVALSTGGAGQPGAAHVIELSADNGSSVWQLSGDDAQSALSARLTYISRLGHAIERVVDSIAGDQLVVRDPLEGGDLRVTLLPSGTGWVDVATAMVDLAYVDGAHVVEETIGLHKLDDLAEWIVPARAEGPREVRWRLHVSYRDGRFTSGNWEVAAPGVILLRLDGIPKRRVQLLPIYFDAARTRQGTVRIRHASGLDTVVIADRTPKVVTLAPGPFTWTIQWTTADGTELEESSAAAGEDVIVVPRFIPR